MKKVLFVCNQGQNRSKTSEEIFKEKFETKSAGLYNNLLTKENLLWADLIVVMEDFQREEISKRFPKEYLLKKIISFNVPDYYRYGQKELITLLKQKEKMLL